MMPQCSNCHKTFTKITMQQHIKTCKPASTQRLNPEGAKSTQSILPKASKSPAPKKSTFPDSSPIQKEAVFSRPRAVMCHIW